MNKSFIKILININLSFFAKKQKKNIRSLVFNFLNYNCNKTIVSWILFSVYLYYFFLGYVFISSDLTSLIPKKKLYYLKKNILYNKKNLLEGINLIELRRYKNSKYKKYFSVKKRSKFEGKLTNIITNEPYFYQFTYFEKPENHFYNQLWRRYLYTIWNDTNNLKLFKKKNTFKKKKFENINFFFFNNFKLFILLSITVYYGTGQFLLNKNFINWLNFNKIKHNVKFNPYLNTFLWIDNFYFDYILILLYYYFRYFFLIILKKKNINFLYIFILKTFYRNTFNLINPYANINILDNNIIKGKKQSLSYNVRKFNKNWFHFTHDHYYLPLYVKNLSKDSGWAWVRIKPKISEELLLKKFYIKIKSMYTSLNTLKFKSYITSLNFPYLSLNIGFLFIQYGYFDKYLAQRKKNLLNWAIQAVKDIDEKIEKKKLYDLEQKKLYYKNPVPTLYKNLFNYLRNEEKIFLLSIDNLAWYYSTKRKFRLLKPDTVSILKYNDRNKINLVVLARNYTLIYGKNPIDDRGYLEDYYKDLGILPRKDGFIRKFEYYRPKKKNKKANIKSEELEGTSKFDYLFNFLKKNKISKKKNLQEGGVTVEDQNIKDYVKDFFIEEKKFSDFLTNENYKTQWTQNFLEKYQGKYFLDSLDNKILKNFSINKNDKKLLTPSDIGYIAKDFNEFNIKWKKRRPKRLMFRSWKYTNYYFHTQHLDNSFFKKKKIKFKKKNKIDKKNYFIASKLVSSKLSKYLPKYLEKKNKIGMYKPLKLNKPKRKNKRINFTFSNKLGPKKKRYIFFLVAYFNIFISFLTFLTFLFYFFFYNFSIFMFFFNKMYKLKKEVLFEEYPSPFFITFNFLTSKFFGIYFFQSIYLYFCFINICIIFFKNFYFYLTYFSYNFFFYINFIIKVESYFIDISKLVLLIKKHEHFIKPPISIHDYYPKL